jgi:hypothetical protein
VVTFSKKAFLFQKLENTNGKKNYCGLCSGLKKGPNQNTYNVKKLSTKKINQN